MKCVFFLCFFNPSSLLVIFWPYYSPVTEFCFRFVVSECKLTDSECPQARKAEMMSNKKDCVFAYKRTAANIAWPKSLK